MTNPSIERVRSRFLLPTDKVYLDGNSLGPLTSEASEHLIEAISQQWGQDLVAAWNKHGWIDLPQTVGNQIAPIIGAHRGNVICCDSLSVNLFKALSAALEINSTRNPYHCRGSPVSHRQLHCLGACAADGSGSLSGQRHRYFQIND